MSPCDTWQMSHCDTWHVALRHLARIYLTGLKRRRASARTASPGKPGGPTQENSPTPTERLGASPLTAAFPFASMCLTPTHEEPTT